MVRKQRLAYFASGQPTVRATSAIDRSVEHNNWAICRARIWRRHAIGLTPTTAPKALASCERDKWTSLASRAGVHGSANLVDISRTAATA